METIVYTLQKLQGDYALLRRIDMPATDTILVARAFLPEEADEGSTLLYEQLAYRMAD